MLGGGGGGDMRCPFSSPPFFFLFSGCPLLLFFSFYFCNCEGLTEHTYERYELGLVGMHYGL